MCDYSSTSCDIIWPTKDNAVLLGSMNPAAPAEKCANQCQQHPKDWSSKLPKRQKHLSPPRSLKFSRDPCGRHRFHCIVSRRKVSFPRGGQGRFVCGPVIFHSDWRTYRWRWGWGQKEKAWQESVSVFHNSKKINKK